LTSQSPQRRAVHAIVPVKVLSKSKVRLSSLLDSKGRADLTVAMLKDVLFALGKARRVGSVTVVSADRKLRAITEKFGAGFVWEARRRGLNKALILAIMQTDRGDTSATLIMHADLPLITGRDVDEFLKQSSGYAVTLNPSKDGAGTNALLLERARIIRPAFGRNSCERHMLLAKRKGLSCKVVRLEGIGFDIDEPMDLLQLVGRERGRNTGRFLQSLLGWI
jgi:2-phospho-L-lactate guanylyltransferase